MSMSSHALLFQVLLLHNLIVWATASAHVQENSQIRCFSDAAAALFGLMFEGRVSLWRAGAAGERVR